MSNACTYLFICVALCLSFSLELVYVKGKRGRQVGVLLSKVELEALDALVAKRNYVGVLKDNVFMFATPTRSSKRHIRGNDAMKNIIKSVEGLKFPERIRSTQLRKYCATVSQIADLKEGDLSWLADHMGHNLNIHREFYRLKESTVELTKVARILCAIDEGNAHKFAGKALAEIEIEGNLAY